MRLKRPSLILNKKQERELKVFYEQIQKKGTCLDLGSSARVLAPGVIRVDIQKKRHPHIVTDIQLLPFKDCVIQGVIITGVLEHVPDPCAVVKEVYRVLRPGGEVYVSVPFMQPYHGDLADYQRYTDMGLKVLFKDFDIIKVYKTRGSGSAMSWMLTEYFTIILSFGNKKLYGFLKKGFGCIFFIMKYLDFILDANPLDTILTSGFTIKARKL